MALPHVLQAFRPDHLQTVAQCPNERVRWCKWRVTLLEGLAVLSQVKVEVARRSVLVDPLPCLVADRRKRKPRRQHKSLSRSGNVDVYVPVVGAAFHHAQATD